MMVSDGACYRSQNCSCREAQIAWCQKAQLTARRCWVATFVSVGTATVRSTVLRGTRAGEIFKKAAKVVNWSIKLGAKLLDALDFDYVSGALDLSLNRGHSQTKRYSIKTT